MSYDNSKQSIFPDNMTSEYDLSFADFVLRISVLFQDRFGSEAEIYTEQVYRVDGTSYDGLFVRLPCVNMSPIINLNQYYNFYLENGWEAAKEIIFTQFEQLREAEPVNLEQLESYECMRNTLTLRLVHETRNEGLLKKLPYRRILDLALFVVCKLKENEDEVRLFVVSEQVLKAWGINQSKLFQDALENMINNESVVIRPMHDVMYEIMNKTKESLGLCSEELSFPDLPPDEPPIYVATTRSMTYGACVVLFPGVLERLADLYEDDLILIPSSIHEFIISSQDIAVRMHIDDLIREVNENELVEEDILSDHSYFYKKNTGELGYFDQDCDRFCVIVNDLFSRDLP